MSNQEKQSQKAEAAQETRRRIIDAAYRVLAEKGYDAATLREIARAADAAPGLVHYYFGGKDQLLVEVLNDVSNRFIETGQQLSESVDAAHLAEIALERPQRWATEEQEWYRLRYELFALGLHNSTLTPGVQELLANGRNAISEIVRKSLGEDKVDPMALATILIASFDGLALQKIMDPDVDLDAAYRVLRQIVQNFQSCD
jgi:AcrR family transcriptional regulator